MEEIVTHYCEQDLPLSSWSGDTACQLRLIQALSWLAMKPGFSKKQGELWQTLEWDIEAMVSIALFSLFASPL